MRTSHRGPRVQFSGACEQSHWWPARHTAGGHLLSVAQAATNILSVSKPSISQRSQIKEDTVEPSVPAWEFNLEAYAAITWHNDRASLGLEPRLADHRTRQQVRRRYQQRHRGKHKQIYCTKKIHVRIKCITFILKNLIESIYLANF